MLGDVLGNAGDMFGRIWGCVVMPLGVEEICFLFKLFNIANLTIHQPKSNRHQ